MSLPRIEDLPSLSEDSLREILDLLFEPSPALHALALPTVRTSGGFTSYDGLIDYIGTLLYELAGYHEGDMERKEKLHAILGAHPRLGEPKKETLSKQSREEQRRLQGDTEEAGRLRELNRVYEETFPGLRYVAFVNGRGRGEIMRDMEGRIARGDGREEEREAIRAMCDIAKDRAGKLLRASE
ncbi:Oxo-4-hydroxy-4-carboxy-5-ureidoimidazoline decarboxylase [Echria macrotheca]|uniref:Oxo-4-hydroxy-4-carboxy-5-ureidoimidazoline decarboxylase n=1 Tax=Echria macrotheca TaxID=438768 RepID=A0AAJ0B4A8_9PEZI|nr:Oxo-4-hydroxy-4-carboxy-5-ureidoimidazoline decarboxylase [Echria macrotheca]